MKSRGFTLIELLVVVAIISLLSSVVIALVGDARDKALSRAFRQDVDQFVKAIELYQSDNSRVPGQPNSLFYYRTQKGFSPVNSSITPALPTALAGYIPKIPTAPFGGYFYYYHNTTIRCMGSTAVPSYVILVSSTEPGFEDWPYYTTNGTTPINSYRCFSIK